MCSLTDYELNVESLRRLESTEFAHLAGEVYLDHAANAIYPSSLISEYSKKLTDETCQGTWSLFSNPHSQSQSGAYTSLRVQLTREKILRRLFNTDNGEYEVVFVNNATAGLKLVAENFRFTSGSSCFAYVMDNHTSVVGMREIAWSNGCRVYCLIEDENQLEKFNSKLVERKLDSPNDNIPGANLFVYPAQSNFNGRKYSLQLMEKVRDTGISDIATNGEWFICLDTASYLSTSPLDLSEHKPDFLVISFYKLFGFPTSLGALLIRKSDRMRNVLNAKKFYGGGTVDMALIDEDKVCLRNCSCTNGQERTIKNNSYHEFLEDGTVPYLEIIAVDLAIEKWQKLTLGMGFNIIQTYVDYLRQYCMQALLSLKHFNGKSLVEIYQKNGNITYGPIVAFNLKTSKGTFIITSVT